MSRYFYTVLDLKVKHIPRRELASKWLVKTAASLGLIVLTYAQSSFETSVHRTGYTIVAVLSESHAVVHAVPESKWVELVLACHKEMPKGAFLGLAREFWKPESVRISHFTGGVPEV